MLKKVTSTKQEKLHAEAESFRTALSIERAQLDAARKEHTTVLDELRRSRDELTDAKQALFASSSALEALKTQHAMLVSQRDELKQDVSRLRQTNEQEVARQERMEDTYKDVEKRLRELRTDLSRAEEGYARAKSLSADEEQRLLTQRRAMRAASSELQAIEAAVANSHKSMQEERENAVRDLGLLGQAKQSIQHQVFALNEAQRRISVGNESRSDARTPLGTITISGASGSGFKKPSGISAAASTSFGSQASTSNLSLALTGLAQVANNVSTSTGGGLGLNTHAHTSSSRSDSVSLAGSVANTTKLQRSPLVRTDGTAGFENLQNSSMRPVLKIIGDQRAPVHVKAGSTDTFSGDVSGSSGSSSSSSSGSSGCSISSSMPTGKSSANSNLLQKEMEKLRVKSLEVLKNVGIPLTAVFPATSPSGGGDSDE